MAATGTVGILRALLTADASTFQSTMKQSAVVAGKFGDSVAKVGDTAQKVTPQLTRMEKAFSGDKLLYSANNLTTAIGKIGGASKLTAAEQEKVNRQLTTAIEKYRALGQQAPAAMLALEQATRKTSQATDGLSTKMVTLGSAVGSFLGNLAANVVQQGVSSIVHLGTAALESAGQIADMAKRLGISATAVQGFQYAAEQSGASIEDFGSAINKLNINLSRGDKSTIAALDDLGLKLSDLRRMKPEDAFLAVADALAKIPDPMERARVGAELMGKGFATISPAIQNDLRKTAEAAAKMSDETVKALDEAGDALDRLKRDATIAAGGVVAAFYQMGAAALDYASKATQAKTKSQEFEDVAARIRKQQSTPELPPAPGLPTLPAIGGGPKPATPQEIARITQQADALAKAAEAQIKWNEAREKERQAIEDATQGMTYWLAGMKTAPALISSLGDSLNTDLIPAAQLSNDAIMALATQGQDSLTRFYKSIVSQNVSAQQSSERLLNFWKTDFKDTALETWQDISHGFTDMLSDAILDLRSFKDAFLQVWESIKRGISQILSSILNEFVNRFLKGLYGYLRGIPGAFSSAFGGLIPGLGGSVLGGVLGGGGAGLLVNQTTPALTAGLTAGASGAAAAAPAAAGGAAFGSSLLALASNPITWGVAGGALLAWGITKKGWFRGGEEGVQVNPARDRYLAKWGPPGTGEGSGFATLAALLTRLTGEPGGGRLFAALAHAQTMKAFTTAVTNIETLLARRGVPSPQLGAGRVPPPTMGAAGGSPLPALSLAASSATLPAPVAIAPTATTTPAAMLAAPASTTVNFAIKAFDPQSLNDTFRDEIIPRLKDALALNQRGLTTAVKRSVN